MPCLLLRWFVFGPWIEYGIDRQLTKYTHGSATVAISAKMGVLLRLKYKFKGISLIDTEGNTLDLIVVVKHLQFHSIYLKKSFLVLYFMRQSLLFSPILFLIE